MTYSDLKAFAEHEGNQWQNRQHTKWEKIFANGMTDKGSKFKIYKQLIQLNKKTKQPNLKMGGRPE